MRHSRRTGFTLIELLIVVVIIGVLAAIAVPKFENTKGRAYTAAMKSDLRNLATAEEGYFFSYNTYTSSLTNLNFIPSVHVTLTIPEATGSGWSAKTTHSSTSTQCAIYMGTAAAVAPATHESSLTCQ